jgi:hypothetical protein
VAIGAIPGAGRAVAAGGALTLPPFSVCFVVAECAMAA